MVNFNFNEEKTETIAEADGILIQHKENVDGEKFFYIKNEGFCITCRLEDVTQEIEGDCVSISIKTPPAILLQLQSKLKNLSKE